MAEDETWVPVSVREAGSTTDYAGPHDGVPDWLFGPLWEWLQGRLTSIAVFHELAAALRIDITDRSRPSAYESVLTANLYALAQQRPMLLVDASDFFLRRMNAPLFRREAAGIERMLVAGGSSYTVRELGGHYALERRIDAATEDALEDLTSGTGVAGEHLKRARASAYGRQPNPGHAYREAVKAVEAAAIPIVSPRNERATLGTLIADLRSQRDRWKLRLNERQPGDQVTVVIGMMETLWHGQVDRHGVPGTDTPVDLSVAEAEAAIHLAMVLVQWFSGGLVYEVGGTQQR